MLRAVNSSGMIKRRASTIAIAIMRAASPPPITPYALGSKIKLAAILEANAMRIVISSSVRVVVSVCEIKVDQRVNIFDPRNTQSHAPGSNGRSRNPTEITELVA